MRRTLSSLTGILASAVLGTASASPMLFDVDFPDSAGAVSTQTGWTSTGLAGQNNVNFTGVGGAVLDGRNRGLSNTDGPSGDTSNNDMWRDFIFADERGADIPSPADAGIDISIDGLLADTVYSVRLWAFDDSSNGGRNMTWNGVPLGIPNSPDPTSLADQVVSFMATSDSTGALLLEGRIGDPRGDCCNVFVNGFEISAVPEPATIAMIALGIAGLGYGQRRQVAAK